MRAWVLLPLVLIAPVQAQGRPEWVRRAAHASRAVGFQASRNAFGLDMPRAPRIVEEAAADAAEAPGIQSLVETFRQRNRLDTQSSGIVMEEGFTEDGTPEGIDEALKLLAKDDTPITEDAYGPIGPGRRERLAALAGLSPEEARQIWPLPDPEPVRGSDLVQAAQKFGGKGMTLTQDEAIAALVPEQNRERLEKLRRTVLTDSEVTFACYAALGLPFPVRVGRVDQVPPEGLVVFVPEMLHADLTRGSWSTRTVTYRWMVGSDEVAKGQVEVSSFAHLPRPMAPITHLWITCDQDVMLYALRGLTPPSGLDEVRQTLFKEVVPVNSWLRPPTKLYGIRWGLLPSLPELTEQPQTRANLRRLLLDLGFIAPKDPTPDMARYRPEPAPGGDPR